MIELSKAGVFVERFTLDEESADGVEWGMTSLLFLDLVQKFDDGAIQMPFLQILVPRVHRQGKAMCLVGSSEVVVRFANQSQRLGLIEIQAVAQFNYCSKNGGPG